MKRPRTTMIDDIQREDTSPATLAKMSKIELLELKLRVDDRTAAITAQLVEARTNAYKTGDYSDSDWFHRAQTAESCSKRDSQRIMLYVAKLREQEKQRNIAIDAVRRPTWERAFIRAAKRIVPEHYERLCQLASEEADAVLE